MTGVAFNLSGPYPEGGRRVRGRSTEQSRG